MHSIVRIYVKKKPGFDVEAKHLLDDIQSHLSINTLENLQIINRYDIDGLEKDQLLNVINLILSDPVVDQVYTDDLPTNAYYGHIKPIKEMKKGQFSFGSEYLPG